MGLKETITNLFKSKETKKKEATATQEAAAEKELQTILSNPTELKNLCSILNSKDGLHFFNLCSDMKAGKIVVKKEALPKASDVIGIARWGNISNIGEMRTKEATLARQWREVQQLKTKADKGDSYSKMTYPQRYRNIATLMEMHTTHQNIYSTCVLNLLQTAVLSGRIKDIDKLQSMIARTQVENNNRKVKLGLVAPTQAKTSQRTGESR